MAFSMTVGHPVAGRELGHPQGYPLVPGTSMNSVSQQTWPQAFNPWDGSRFQQIGATIWNKLLISEGTELTGIFNRRQVEGPSVTVQRLTIENGMMEENPHWTSARLISASRHVRIARLEKFGISLEMEGFMANDPYGGDQLVQLVKAITMAQLDRMALEVIIALHNASADSQRKRFANLSRMNKTAYEALSTEILFYGALQTLQNPLESIAATIDDEMRRVGGSFDTIILPAKAKGLVKTSIDEYLRYRNMGQAGPDLRTGDIRNAPKPLDFPGFGNVAVIVIEPTPGMLRHYGGRDLMDRLSVVGEWYPIDPTDSFGEVNWSENDQAIKIYDEQTSEYKRISLEDVLLNTGLFDGDGNVKELSALDYDTEYPIDGTNVDDMFSTASGHPIRVFGEMRGRYLSAKDRVRWARTALSKLDDGEKTKLTALLATVERLSQSDDPEQDWEGALIGQDTPTFGMFDVPMANYPPQVSNAGKNEKGAFIFNVLMPHYPPLFKAAPADAGNNAAKATRLAALYTAIFGGDQAGIRALAKDDDVVKHAIQAYALNIITRRGGNPGTAKDEVDNKSKLIQFPNLDTEVAKLHGKDRTDFDAVVKEAWKVYIDNKDNGNARVSYTMQAKTFITRKMAKILLANWNAGNAVMIPGDPDNPWMPIEKEKLERLLGDRSDSPHWSIGAHWSTPPIMALALQHTAAVQHSHDHGSDEHAEVHAAIAAQGSSRLSDLLSQTQRSFVGGRYGPGFGIPTGITGEQAKVLIGMSSDEYIKNWAEVSAVASGMERVMCQLFAMTKVSLHSLKRFMAYNIPLPFGALVFRPNITHYTSSAIALKRGDQTGYIAIGPTLWTPATNAHSQSIYGQWNSIMGCIIETPENVLVVDNLLENGYVQGGSTGWIIPHEELNNSSSRTASLCAQIVPLTALREGIKPVLSITGSVADVPTLAELQVVDEGPFPQATRFTKTYGTRRFLDDQLRYGEEVRAAAHNLVCVRGQYVTHTPEGFTCLHEGIGHHKNTDGAGAKLTRTGGFGARYGVRKTPNVY